MLLFNMTRYLGVVDLFMNRLLFNMNMLSFKMNRYLGVVEPEIERLGETCKHLRGVS